MTLLSKNPRKDYKKRRRHPVIKAGKVQCFHRVTGFLRGICQSTGGWGLIAFSGKVKPERGFGGTADCSITTCWCHVINGLTLRLDIKERKRTLNIKKLRWGRKLSGSQILMPSSSPASLYYWWHQKLQVIVGLYYKIGESSWNNNNAPWCKHPNFDPRTRGNRA